METNMDGIVKLMSNKRNIRNMSVIAHVDHGKSTLTDCLLIRALVCKKDSHGGRFMDTREDEKARGITIKSNAVSLHFKIDRSVLTTYLPEDKISDSNEFLINLIDSPGHVDFSSEVTAALRITDGAVTVVDTVDGVCVQTKSVLEQALRDRITPTLVLNKLDRAIVEMNYPISQVGQLLYDRVDSFNAELSEINRNLELNHSKPLDPIAGEISFCSGLQGWGMTLSTVARKFLKVLGSHSFDKEQKFTRVLWSKKVYCVNNSPFEDYKFKPAENGVIPEGKVTPLEMYVLGPIYKVKELSMALDYKGLSEYLGKFQHKVEPVTLKNVSDDWKKIFGHVMKILHPASDCLLEQIVLKLPSPEESQTYRSDYLYTGDVNDAAGQAIKLCQSGEKDPVMMYVSKMVPDGKGFVALGRIFSGVIKPGSKLFVQAPEHDPTAEVKGKSQTIAEKTISRVCISMGRGFRDVSYASAGNIVALGGLDTFLVKTGTVTSVPGAFNIRTMKFMVSPVVKVSVRPKDPSKLQAFKEGLNKLAKSDPMIVVDTLAETGPTVACAGELHLEIIVTDLRKFAGCEFFIDKPSIKYFEGITKEVDTSYMVKSPNKHNRIFMSCEPIDKEVLDVFSQLCDSNIKEVSRKFKEVLGMDDEWIKDIMFFGPEVDPMNLLVNETKGIQYLNEVKDHLRAGFWGAASEGPLVGEIVQGVRYNLTDLVLHADAIHRGAGQISTPMRNLCKALMLKAGPILYEPIFHAIFSLPGNINESVIDRVINARRGIKFIPDDDGYTPGLVHAKIPVAASFGMHKELMESTGGQVSLTLSLDTYDICPGSLEKENSEMALAVAETRKIRKVNFKLDPEEYFDKL